MIDVHAHLLPKMDDGSKNTEQSFKMLHQMREQGVSCVAVTPHFDMRKESVAQFVQRRERAFQSLEKERNQADPRLILGAEVLYCGVNLSRLDGIEMLCIGEGRYMLVETLHRRWDDSFEDCLCKLIAEQNIIPIIAHIERYLFDRGNRKILRRLRARGVLLQSNAEFFIRKTSRRAAIRLLKRGMIHVIGSDCHGSIERAPNLEEAFAIIKKQVGDRAVAQLMERAESVVSGSARG